MPAKKRCPKCGTVKPRTAFNLNRAEYDGLQSYCRLCMSRVGAKYRADNRRRYREMLAQDEWHAYRDSVPSGAAIAAYQNALKAHKG